MTVKQLKSLIAAGVFSAALLTGVSYAETAPGTATSAPAAKSKKMRSKKMKHATKKEMKEAAKHACGGQNSCKGHGGCATDGSKGMSKNDKLPQHSCKGKNDCKGQGGCAS